MHLADYLAVLRNNKLVASVVFVVVFAAMMRSALFRDPVFEAEALVKLETQQPGSQFLGEIMGAEHAATDAEMEVMRTLTVAQGAAAALVANDFLVEEHAYRPFEVLLHEFGNPPKCSASVDVELPTDPSRELLAYFEFGTTLGPDGLPTLLRVGRRNGPEGEEPETVQDWASGRPFEALGHTFVLNVRGDAAGRRFHLDLWTRNRIASFIRSKASVREVGTRTGVVALRCGCANPILAKRIADALADSYCAYRQQSKGEHLDRAAKFLHDQTDSLGEKLRRAEAALDAYRTESGATLLASRGPWIVEKLSTLESERSALTTRLAEGERLLAGIDTESGFVEAIMALGGASDPLTDALGQTVSELELKQSLLKLGDTTPAHPVQRRLRAEIEMSRAKLERNVRLLLTRRIRNTRVELDTVDTAMKRYRAELDRLPATERRITELTRDVEAYLRAFTLLKEKQTDVEIAMASKTAPVRVIDRAVVPSQHLSPGLLREVLLATLFGIVAALGAAFLREYLDRSIKNPSELEEGVGVPLYAALPLLRSIRTKGMRKPKGALVTIDHPKSMLAENYRTLGANIRFANLERPLSTLAITSSVQGEGKTVTTVNLAAALAQGGNKVIVVDADLRCPSTHILMKEHPSPGLTDVLTGETAWQDVVRRTSVENLDFIFAGSQPANPWALFDSRRFHEMLAELKTAYEYVLFDVPPVLVVADTAALFPSLDGVLLLARHKGCTVDVVMNARDQIDRIGANLVGVIFNGFDARKAVRSGYGAYGYYESYRKYGYESRYGDGESTGDRPMGSATRMDNRVGDTLRDKR